MCLDYQEFEHCYLYCLPQSVETNPALSQESQEVVKQQHFADVSELFDKMNIHLVRVMFLWEIWTQILSAISHQELFEEGYDSSWSHCFHDGMTDSCLF